MRRGEAGSDGVSWTRAKRGGGSTNMRIAGGSAVGGNIIVGGRRDVVARVG